MELKSIIKSTAKLFLKYGIRSVTMDDVARELSISKKTLYQYVNDKNDLVEKIILYHTSIYDTSNFHKTNNMNVIEKYIVVFNEVTQMLKNNNQSFEYDLKKYYPKQFKILIESRRKVIMDKMTKDLVIGIKEGYFRNDLDVKKIAILHLIRIESIKNTDLLSEYGYKTIDIIDELFRYHIHAIATPKGIEEYKRLNLLNHE